MNLPPELIAAATELARTERARYLSISLVYRQPNDGSEAALYCLLDEWPTSEAAQIAAAHREIERLRAELEQAQACVVPASRNGHQPDDLICKKCGQHFQRVQGLRKQPRSLDAPVREEGDTSLGALLPDPATSTTAPVEQAALREDLLRAVRGLGDERTIQIVMLRYGLDDGQQRTLEQVGQQLGITRERVRQIEEVALRRLRHPHLGAGLRAYLGEGVAV